MRFLDDCIILFVHANPDGNDLVADWYMRNPIPEQRIARRTCRGSTRSTSATTTTATSSRRRRRRPRTSTACCTTSGFRRSSTTTTRAGRPGTVVWSPPLRDPYNYNLDPLLVLGLQSLGAPMHKRLAAEGQAGRDDGVGRRRTTAGGMAASATPANFHNIIAMLTEMIGSPTPMRIPLVLAAPDPVRAISPYPIAPQAWHFRQSIDYSMSLNRAVLDYASRKRENLLYNIYRMGQRAIERGSGDYVDADRRRGMRLPRRGERCGGGRGGEPTRRGRWAALRNAGAARSARLHHPVGPARLPDRDEVHQRAARGRHHGAARDARRSRSAARRYPAGSFVVMTGAGVPAARDRHVRAAGSSQRDSRIPARRRRRRTTTPAGRSRSRWACSSIASSTPVHGSVREGHRLERQAAARPGCSRRRPTVFVLTAAPNDAFVAVNRLLAAWDVECGAADDQARSTSRPTPRSRAVAWRPLGVTFAAVRDRPDAARPLRAPRIGLWDQYGGSMDVGLDALDPRAVRVPVRARVRAGARCRQPQREVRRAGVRRAARFPPSRRRRARRAGRTAAALPGRIRQTMPAEYRAQLGRVTPDRTIPQLREFIENGGTVIAIGDSADEPRRVPRSCRSTNHLVENGAPLPRAKFYVPGSVLSARSRHDATRWPPACASGPTSSSTTARCSSSAPAPKRGGPRLCVVRLTDAAAQRMGVGPEVPRRRHRGDRSEGRQGPRRPLRPGDPAARPAARHVQAAVQRALRVSQ